MKPEPLQKVKIPPILKIGPSQTSNIQQNLNSPLSGDDFKNNDNRVAWHSVHHSHKLNNGEGEVKFGKGIPNHTEIVSWTAGSTTMKNFRPIKDRYNSSRSI